MIAEVLLVLLLQQTGWAFRLSARKAIMGKDVNIPCSFTVKNPPIDGKVLAITWYFQGKEILSVQNAVVNPTDRRMSNTGRAEDGIADLSISNITIMDGGIYKCSIVYKTEKTEEEIRLDVQAPPQITITDKVILNNKESSLHSVISGFYPVDIDIKWYRDGQILSKVIMEEPQRDPDGTYSVRSSVTIIPTKEDRERIFSCRVQHESLTTPLQEDFRLVYGAMPYVHITSKPFLLNVEQNLVCSVSNFYPEAITVNWFLNGTLLKNTKTRRNSNSAVYAVYQFTPMEENWGMELSCVVEHGTFTIPHVERLLVQASDLKRKDRLPSIITSVVLVSILGALTIVLLYIKKRKKRLPKVRNITHSLDFTFSLTVDHFDPEDIKISWELVQPPSSTQPRAIGSDMIRQQNQDGTFNATSTCESLRGLIKEDQEYVVRAVVEHSKLKRPSYREWRSDDKDNKNFHAQLQAKMEQIPKLFVKEHTQLQCTMSRFYPNELTVDWFMKKNGQEELTPIGNSGRYKIPDTKSQAQADKTFTHTTILEITPLMEDVESEIICRVSHPSLKEPIYTTTGPLQVLAKPELQQPIKLTVTDSGDVMGHLTLVNFYPKNINIAWTCNYVQNREEMPSEEVTNNPDGTFTVYSQYKISGKLFENPKLTMKVTWKHETMEEPEYREVGVQDPDFPWHLRIEHVSPLILQKNRETKVTCKISSYFRRNLRVTWLEKKGTFVTDCRHKTYKYHISDIKHDKMADNTYQCSPSLSFTPTSDEEDLEFICRVEHPSLDKPLEQSTGLPRINVPPQEAKHAQFTIHEPDKVLCSLSLMKFYPKNMNINWSHGQYSPRLLPSRKKIIETDDEKTFDAISECIVPWKHFDPSLRVTWTHESLKEAGWQDLRMTDFPWRPVIEEISESPIIENTSAKLKFKISNYFPSNLAVTWYKIERNGKPVSQHRQDISIAEKQPDKTYSCTTSCTITPSLKDQGSEFICYVEHPALEEPIERSTGPLQVCARPKYEDPIQWSLTKRREPALILHLHRFYPKSIEIKWSCTCGQSLHSDNIYQNNETTFNVTSECRLPQEHMTHPDHAIRVTWKHVAMAYPEYREVSVRDTDFPWRPKVTEISNPVLQLGQSVTVQCDISHCFPANLTVMWYVKEKGSKEYIDLSRRRDYKITISPLQYSDSGYFFSTSVQFTPSLSSQGVMFMCQVEHPSLENPIKRITEPLFITLSPKLTDPVKLTPCEPGEVLCSVRLEKFFPKGINFTWTFGGKECSACTPKKTLLVEEDVDIFSAISECRIPWNQLKFPVRVSWKHEADVTKRQYTELTGPDFPWLPRVEALDPPCLILNTESKIQCRISGYFTEDLTVNWFKKEENTDNPISVTNDRMYKIPNLVHHRQPDNTYSCTASLLFTPTQMDQGLEFICRVGHPGMERPTEERIRPLQVMACPRYEDQRSLTNRKERQGTGKPDHMGNAGLLCRPHIDPPVISDLKLNSECKIQCRVSGYYPDNVTITWLKKEKRQDVPVVNMSKYKIPQVTHNRQPDNTYSCTAILIISSLQREENESEFICRVDHPSLEQPIEGRTGPLKTNVEYRW